MHWPFGGSVWHRDSAIGTLAEPVSAVTAISPPAPTLTVATAKAPAPNPGPASATMPLLWGVAACPGAEPLDSRRGHSRGCPKRTSRFGAGSSGGEADHRMSVARAGRQRDHPA
jgi:hypothetical protein